MDVVVTGASGFIGSALRPKLEEAGHTVVALTRTRRPDSLYWDPATGEIDAAALEGHDAVVHLAGQPVAGRRWTESYKTRVADSRIRGTHLLASTLASLDSPPRVLLRASAIGFYGNRGDEILTEDSGRGKGFLAGVVERWEQASEPAEEAGIRVVSTRSGIVLGPHGGALPPMALPFRFGVGGKLGSGRQWFSWVALEDEVSAMAFLLEHDDLAGTFNLVAPNPVRNADLTKVLGRVLRRPAFLTVPDIAMKLLLGTEMAIETVLSGQRVSSEKLVGAGYSFRYTDLEDALRAIFGRS